MAIIAITTKAIRISHNYNYQYRIPKTERQQPAKPKFLCNSVKLNLIRMKRKRRQKALSAL